MYIIHRGPKMSFGSHGSFRALAPDLTSAGIINAVPIIGSAAVHLSESGKQRLDCIRMYEQMVMIRKDAPGMYFRNEAGDCLKQKTFG
jgi:hypothetical protein